MLVCVLVCVLLHCASLGAAYSHSRLSRTCTHSGRLGRCTAPSTRTGAMTASETLPSSASPVVRAGLLKTLWKFTRPHTIMGSGLSVLSIFAFASAPNQWRTLLFWRSLGSTMLPALFMNLYITGLNQVTDVEIDRVNKPYLPIPAGDLSVTQGAAVVGLSLVASLLLARGQPWPLHFTLLSSAVLGTVYSLPPFRLKRFPLLAALCILVVRGSVVNVGFFLQAKALLLGQVSPSLAAGMRAHPECVLITLFFAVFSVVIAILKDVPDIKGDALYRIPTFSVILGAKRVFRTAWLILVALLSAASAASLGSIPWRAGAGLGLSTGLLSAALGILAVDVRRRALLVESESSEEAFSYYMYVWNVFFACYFLLPLAKA